MLENKIYYLNDLLNIIKKKKIQLDVVTINNNLNPPLVKLLDYNKFIYNKKKKIKKNIHKKNIKIIRLSPQIDGHDTNFKIKKAKIFLKKRFKVKFYVFFKGREIIYKNKGMELLIKCSNLLNKYGKILKYPYMDKNKMYMIIIPI
ncbi:MAG: translation initiation factor IF-3 [Candidatus Shikimatogenerans bostrichidophilus]|nr:MAG: translation initiation factor IF-3 [Candidatus Shikimatogenerans bostrichidophilus]